MIFVDAVEEKKWVLECAVGLTDPLVSIVSALQYHAPFIVLLPINTNGNFTGCGCLKAADVGARRFLASVDYNRKIGRSYSFQRVFKVSDVVFVVPNLFVILYLMKMTWVALFFSCSW